MVSGMALLMASSAISEALRVAIFCGLARRPAICAFKPLSAGSSPFIRRSNSARDEAQVRSIRLHILEAEIAGMQPHQHRRAGHLAGDPGRLRIQIDLGAIGVVGFPPGMGRRRESGERRGGEDATHHAFGDAFLETFDQRHQNSPQMRKRAKTSPDLLSGPEIKGEPTSRRSEEHTSEHQSLMRTSYAVFCLKKKI